LKKNVKTADVIKVEHMKKKILVIDDSALMRRVICDIINADDRFEVADIAHDGVEGLKLILQKQYDAIVLDVYMPRMTGLELLRELQKSNLSFNILVASTTTKEGARETLLALEYGALDFIQKPENIADTKSTAFKDHFLMLLDVVSNANFKADKEKNAHTYTKTEVIPQRKVINEKKGIFRATQRAGGHANKVVAIAASTGGPKALQQVIPRIQKDIKAPILLVQHMPRGFTRSLAERLNELSEVFVKEAENGDILRAGYVYVAPGGKHMKVIMKDGEAVIQCTDEPTREGVKPCANYMFESLAESKFDEIICVVLTGMGGDGTAGIVNLALQKRVRVVAQDEQTCAVYGMPKSIFAAGLVDTVVPIELVADEIIKSVGVR
jgi:two-component system, chemotaxis family, protein-glutamate methylesterase/glutaminase